MTKDKKSIRLIILKLIPFILATLILLPRLISAQFGLFDDADSLSQSQRFLNGDFSMSHDKQAGRFRPIYWFYYTIIYALAGYHPFWYFLGNLILLFILLIEIRQIILRMGGAEWQVLLTSVLFVLSMPIIENFYTLSKGEPLQLVFLLAAVITLTPKRRPKQNNPWVLSLLATLFILLAIMVKETAIVMIPITFLWAAYLTLSKDETLRKDRTSFLYLFGASILAAIVYFGLRMIVGIPLLTSGTYTDRYLLDPSVLLQKILRWITQFAFYFHYMIPIALILILLILFSSSISKRLRFDIYRWAIWWVLFFFILVPWEYAEVYYLLPFAFGGVMLISLASPIIIQNFTQKKGSLNYSVIILTVLSIVLFSSTLPNYLTDAKTQLTFDRVNHDMLTYISKISSNDETVLINIESPNEYSEKLEIYLKEHYHLKDISYENINAGVMESLSAYPDALVVMPFIDNQPHLTVRAGLEETYQDPWNQTLLTTSEGYRQSLKTVQDSFQLTNINLPVLLCRFGIQAGFCQNPDPLFDFRTLTYGWSIFRIQ